MKAIICTRYGEPDVLRLREVDQPIPNDNEVRIRIHATTVAAGDVRVRGFSPPPMFKLPMRFALGFTKPRKPILGVEMAGEVEAVGKAVSRFRVGDQLVGATGFHFGGYAQYVCMPEKAALAIKPAGLSYEEAAAVPIGGLTALHYLRKGRIHSGQQVLIYGASGSLGTYAVQLAKHFGAEVTGVCSTANAELVRSLGADHVIDYTKADMAKLGGPYDIIFDTVGKSSFAACKQALKPKGFYLLAVTGFSQTVRGLWTSLATGKSVIAGMASERAEDLAYLIALIEAGAIKPVIDRRYRLEQIAEAHRYVEQGHKKGNVVITVEH